jgi:TonB-linked SusC/RagA family outer membrane protein
MTLTFRWLCTRVLPLALLPGMVLAQQPARIAGQVTDPAGTGLAGATVVLPALGLGATAGADGAYSIVVPSARVQNQVVGLTARAIGYKPQSAQITLSEGAIDQNFTLEANPLQLGEIVVTGAGTVTEAEKLGNVRNYVDSTSLTQSNEPNMVQALAAKAPNVVVTQQSGEPGASSSIQIRGVTTVNGPSAPLFVVDGVPMSNYTQASANFDDIDNGSLGGSVAPNRVADVNPEDIANVEILKGAAAGAIYGARAGQGVVLITTKTGQPGQTRYSLKSTFSVDRVTDQVPLQRRFGQGFFDATTGDTVAGIGSQSWGPALAPGTVTYDHSNELFSGGSSLDNSLTISGGTDRTQFYLSGSRLDQNGYITGRNDIFERTTVRLNATHRVFETLRVGGNFAYAETGGRFLQKGSNVSGLMLGALRTPPEFNNLPYLDPATSQHRSYRRPNPVPADLKVGRGYDNPFFTIFESPSTGDVNRAFGNVNLDYTALGWLRLGYTLGADFSSDERFEGLPNSSSTAPAGRVIAGTFRQREIYHNLTATAAYTASRDLGGSVTLGQNLSSRRFQAQGTVGSDLIAPQPFNLENTAVQEQPVDADTLVHNESYFAQATADLWEQVYLTAALRNDGSSTFGEGARRNWYPKASVAWTFTGRSSEPRRFGPISYGKARFAYGQTGTEPRAYQILSTFLTSPNVDGGWGPTINSTLSGQGGLLSAQRRAQDSLKPERTIEFEGGVDLGLFNDRADLSLTYYSSLSKDVILITPLAPSTGFFEQIQNSGRIRNKGFEAVLNVRAIETPAFGWEVGLQWATNNNRVRAIEGAEFVTLGPSFTGIVGVAQPGHAVGSFQGNDFVRCGKGTILDDGTDVDAACGGAPAGAMYIDNIGGEGLPIFDPELRILGSPEADWTGSIRTSLRFQKLRVSGLLDIRHGGQVWNGTRGALYFFGTHKDTEARGQQRTIGTDYFLNITEQGVAGPGAGLPFTLNQEWYQGLGGSFGGPSAPDVVDGGFVKLREISVAYTLSGDPLSRLLGLTSIDLRVAGRNLATWTDYPGIDPETNLSGAQGQVQGYDYFNNPQARSFVFSVGLNR